jgi:hypothetical protein
MMFTLHVKAPQTAKRELRESTFFPLSPTGSIVSHFWNGKIFILSIKANAQKHATRTDVKANRFVRVLVIQLG